jgi:hypothetical protein
MIAMLVTLGLVLYPGYAFAWDSSPQIAVSLDGSGDTILTIQFDFSQMSNPPTPSHYPTAFQVRTSIDGSTWTELASVPISPTPTTTVFTETYNLGKVSGIVQVQARLDCSVHGWSVWGPNPAIPAPEFPSSVVAITSLVLLGGLLLLRRSRIRAAA